MAIVSENEKTDIQPGDVVYKFSDMVDFKITYPKDFKKTKHYKDGEVVNIHLAQARDWEARGLGSIQKKTK